MSECTRLTATVARSAAAPLTEEEGVDYARRALHALVGPIESAVDMKKQANATGCAACISSARAVIVPNRSLRPLDVAVDGRPAGEIPAGESIDARFVGQIGTIAQLPHSSFYLRLREKFGRLAS